MKHSAVPLTATVTVEPLGVACVDAPPCPVCGAVLRATAAAAVTVGEASGLAYTDACAACGVLVECR